MKRLVLLSAILAAPLVGSATIAPSQANAGEVAIIDLSYIFKHSKRFEQLSKDMEKDLELAEEEYKNDTSRLQKSFDQLKEFKKGTDEYKEVEERLAKDNADLRVATDLKKKDFIEREARNHYVVYKEILARIEEFSEKHDISLVMVFDGEPIDANTSDSVLKGLNRQVVWYAKEIDITADILEELNSSARPAPAGAAKKVTGLPKRNQ